MATNHALRFQDFPYEIQQLILWKCLEGWKATVEIHDKEGKSTTRLWSSVIYDALMLSLTCKSFHDMIQKIQKDPRLFSGNIDLIDANAELSYLVGVFTSYTGLYVRERDSVPTPLYRTQIFIKAQPYDRSNPLWRLERLQYHAEVRHWLIQNTTSIGLWADEVNSRVPWDIFPNLENVTLFWPHGFLVAEHPSLYLCEHTTEDLVSVAQKSENTNPSWLVKKIKPIIDEVTEQGLHVTLILEAPHAHERGQRVDSLFALNDGSDAFETRVFYKLVCQVQVNGTEWKVDSVICHDQSQVEIDLSDVFESSHPRTSTQRYIEFG